MRSTASRPRLKFFLVLFLFDIQKSCLVFPYNVSDKCLLKLLVKAVLNAVKTIQALLVGTNFCDEPDNRIIQPLLLVGKLLQSFVFLLTRSLLFLKLFCHVAGKPFIMDAKRLSKRPALGFQSALTLMQHIQALLNQALVLSDFLKLLLPLCKLQLVQQ